MNRRTVMPPQSPGLSGSPPWSPLSPKKTPVQSLGSMSSEMFSPKQVKRPSHMAKQGANPLNSPSLSIMSSPKLWHKASVSRLAEEFFWIGGSVVAQPKWRLGQIGKSYLSFLLFFVIHLLNRKSTTCWKSSEWSLLWNYLCVSLSVFSHAGTGVREPGQSSREADNGHMDSRQSFRISLNDVPAWVTCIWALENKQRLATHTNPKGPLSIYNVCVSVAQMRENHSEATRGLTWHSVTHFFLLKPSFYDTKHNKKKSIRTRPAQ